MSWEFATEPEFQKSLDWMDGFVREEIWPLESIADSLGAREMDLALAPLRAQVKERRLWAAHLSPELGGQGYGQVKLGLMHEIIGTSPIAPHAFGNQAPDSGNSELLALAGTPEQKEQYLEPLLAGTYRSGFSMTEPDTAGSDPTVMHTMARREGDEYVINGRKWFTTNGSVADFLIVMAITDPDAAPHRRASMLLVDATAPGVTIERDVPTMEHPVESFGLINSHSEIRYEDVRVPVTALLGGEGEGFTLAQHRLGPGRIHHCMRWLGVARRAFDMLCERATYRSSHGKTLGQHQSVQNWIADSAAEMHAARLMTLNAAWLIDQRGAAAARREIAMIKFYGAQVLYNVVDRALQAHGALGYSTDLPLEQMYRYARGARIYDGPDEVHRVSVARGILRNYEPPPNNIPSEFLPARRALARERFGELLEAATQNA